MADTSGAANVHINLSGFKKFERIIDQGLRGRRGPIRDAIHQWAFEYFAFVKDRFDRYSKGGGNWRRLENSTIYKRRHQVRRGKFGRGKDAYFAAVVGGFGAVSILRDTGIMFKALNPQVKAKGQERTDIDNGIRVGFGGPAKHPGRRTRRSAIRGRATIADIAAYHQKGNPKGGLPQRKIIVQPDSATRKKMVEHMGRGIQRALKASEIR